MNYIVFNILMIVVSYGMDKAIVDLMDLEYWSQDYIFYTIVFNLPISVLITIVIMRKMKQLFNFS